MSDTEDLSCKCGHARRLHVNGRARCAVNDLTTSKPCGCVQFEIPERSSLLSTAVNLDERLEVAERELKLTRSLLRDLLADESVKDIERVVEENERLKRAIERVIGDPLSSRASVQTILLNALHGKGNRP